MEFEKNGCLLRIFVGENDRAHGRPLYEWLVEEAKKQELAGATVIRGIMGFGKNSRITTSRILRLSSDLPVIVEIVDTHDRLEAYLDSVEDAIGEGLATLEKADVKFYRAKRERK
jgi:PII-like signaling protein